MDGLGTAAAEDLVGRIDRDINAHDLESLVDCFGEGFVSETPVHPARDFQGRDHVRQNWGRIFDAVPDLSSTLVRSIVSEETAWAEWEWTGTRRDGARHLMRGVTIIGIGDGRAASVRFYMEPVDPDGPDAATAVRRILAGDRSAGERAGAGAPSQGR